MPSSAPSSATVQVSPRIPCFAATYAVLPTSPASASVEAVLTIRPHPFPSHSREHGFDSWRAVPRLTASNRSHCSVGKVLNTAHKLNAGIVYENIDVPELRGRRLNQGASLSAVGQIVVEMETLAAA